jgi:aryl-alcohol dehydrogenase-like predicted oxidoreductase
VSSDQPRRCCEHIRGTDYVPQWLLKRWDMAADSNLKVACSSSAKFRTEEASLGATTMQLALAWLLQGSPNLLLIPGTSSLAPRRENLQASRLHIPAEVLANLNSIDEQEREF